MADLLHGGDGGGCRGGCAGDGGGGCRGGCAGDGGGGCRGACAMDGGGGCREHVLGMVEEGVGSMCWRWWGRV